MHGSDGRLRVVFDGHALTPHRSGIGEYSLHLLGALIDSHLGEIDLRVYAGAAFHRVDSRDALTQAVAGVRDGDLYRARRQVELARLLRSGDADVLHVPDFPVPLLHGRVRVVATIHDLIPLVHPAFLPHSAKTRFLPLTHAVMRTAARVCTRVITVSAVSRRDLLRHLPIRPERIDVIACAPGLDLFTDTLPAQLAAAIAGRPYLLYVGRHDPYKGVALLLDAFARADLDGALLVIAGKEDARYPVAPLVRERGLDSRVLLTGYVEPATLAALYARAHALAMPSLYEGFGLPPLDAMRRDVPVLCSDRASLPEVAGDAALLADPENTDAFTHAVTRIMRDDALRADLVRRGRARVAGYTWAATAAATVRSYRRCMEPA
jgi:glycosyltransferase involved in cell wall biosynthesis